MDLQDIRPLADDTHPRWLGGDRSATPQKRYYYRNHKRNLEREKRYYKEVKYARAQKIRRDALMVVGGGVLECSRCGCPEFQLLEINHMNGCDMDRLKNGKRLSGENFWKKVVSGERGHQDLNILCKVCNIIYLVRTSTGFDRYNIKWNP